MSLDVKQQRPTTGVDLIGLERTRQKLQEGWTPEHDDAHDMGELVTAAVCYAVYASHQVREQPPPVGLIETRWPWASHWWKPSDPIRNLQKAGALIAAELDRLQRRKERT